jgi:N-acetylmuramoyl-L-alanine amidase
MRLAVSDSRHFWILKEDLAMESVQPAPTSAVRTVNLKSEPTGMRIAIPLNQRLPYEVEQQLNPNRLSIKVYGATSDTDWITPAREQEKDLIDHVTWKQLSDRVYQVTAWLKGSRQWGYWVDYDDSTLNLHIKAAPNIVAEPESLQGLTICVDPGHGGEETGAMGPSGVKESTINLGIALKLRELLEQAGARVIMTRTSDDETVSLSSRVETAVRANSNLLLSIHGNALPDGRDPWADHGTSSYWYHPQAVEYSKTLREALVKELGFPNFGTFYQNLALTRPSNMPSALVEVGFIINPDEYAQLITPQVQDRAARGLLQGIKDYVKR